MTAVATDTQTAMPRRLLPRAGYFIAAAVMLASGYAIYANYPAQFQTGAVKAWFVCVGFWLGWMTDLVIFPTARPHMFDALLEAKAAANDDTFSGDVFIYGLVLVGIRRAIFCAAGAGALALGALA